MARRNCRIEADAQLPHSSPCLGVCRADHRLQIIENPPCAFQKVAPSRGGLHAAIASFEQLIAEPILKGSDTAAQIGLLEPKRVGRLAEAAIMDSRIGIAQMLKLNRHFRSEEHTSEVQSLMRISYA